METGGYIPLPEGEQGKEGMERDWMRRKGREGEVEVVVVVVFVVVCMYSGRGMVSHTCVDFYKGDVCMYLTILRMRFFMLPASNYKHKHTYSCLSPLPSLLVHTVSPKETETHIPCIVGCFKC